MVDFNKISDAVKNAVKDIAKTEGKKGKIDTRKEILILGNYLAGNAENMNKHEVEYVHGIFAEAQQAMFEANVTDATKDVIKDIAKRTYDKKKIDSDEEAQALALLLRNSKGDLNRADIEYIKQVLIKNGYEHYIPRPIIIDTGYGAPSNKNSTEESHTCPADNECGTTKDTNVEAQKGEEQKPTPRETTKADKPIKKNPFDKVPKEVPQTPKEGDNKTAPPNKKNWGPLPPATEKEYSYPNAYITEKGRTEGLAIVHELATELNSTIVNNSKVNRLIWEIDRDSAYTVLTAFNQVSDKGVTEKTLVNTTDIFDRLTYREIQHIITSLTLQAFDMGLGDNEYCNILEAESQRIEVILSHDKDADPDKATAKAIDNKIKNLLKAMSAEIKKNEKAIANPNSAHIIIDLDAVQAELDEHVKKLAEIHDNPYYTEAEKQELRARIKELTRMLVESR